MKATFCKIESNDRHEISANVVNWAHSLGFNIKASVGFHLPYDEGALRISSFYISKVYE